ncbi:GNAT family N-acetyltransferase [Thermoactinospora rubra]|uniref:GNAT family N-acetyltransferase n=1 Tax=Thermoactinospora rubra TaxID=1088767 RepID=UPI000A10CB2E|nr:GNAT family N-acetyltransferase [Thermoactinospora rubra]
MTIVVGRDAWGIPHVKADNALELAFAQGRVTAVDRAWQLEIERHRARGTSAAFLGAEAAGWDVFARQARLDDTARRCFAALRRGDPDTAAWVAAYADGVNDGLAEGARRAPEFAAVGLEPGRWEPWTPMGIWLSAHILFAGFPAKLWREEVIRHLGPEAVGLFATDGPGTSGSNGWLLAGVRTATGLPLIAGDPHRFIEDPGVYQQIHLACPEYDVVGLAIPGIPGIAHFGHTGTVAWAITNAMADYQDLYRERLRRTGEGVEALGPGGWRPAHRHTETVEVAGDEPVEVEVVETERGPVIIFLGGPAEGEGEGISLRYPPRVREDLGFGALPALLAARRVADVDRALDAWAEPLNVVLAADVEGGLLHRVAGAVPVRHDDNRVRAVPAWEAGHEWRGWHRPPRGEVRDGLAVMANDRGLAAPLGVEFAAPHRAARIRRLLESRNAWSAADMAAIHTDDHLSSAAPLLDHLSRLDGLSPPAARLRDRLLAWDRRMAAGSADAGAFAAVRGAVVRRLAAHPALAALSRPPAYPALFLPWLNLASRVAYALEHLLREDLTAGPLPGLDAARAVREALEEVAATGNPGMTWGQTHRLAAWRALPYGQDARERPPALSGDHDCVLCTSSVPGVTDLAARGPAARYVWDLARREDSRWVVPFGASGVPGSPHHRDQLPLWLNGELVPVITDWDRLATESFPTPNPTPSPTPRRTTPMTARAWTAAGRAPVHEQHVEGFGTVRLLRVDPAADVDVLHGWVTQERARFWGMSGFSREEVLRTYEHLDSLTTHHAYLAVRDDTPLALFQTYEPQADRVSECYDPEPGDIGAHVLIGPAEGEARPGFTGALLSVLVSFAFGTLGRRRIVAEPDAGNDKAISRLVRMGAELGPVVVLPEVDLPEVYLPAKRAQLAFLTREPVS